MNVLLLTGYDDAFAEIGDPATGGKRAYALRHGYQFECVRDYPKDVHPSWHKLRMVQDRIDHYDGILWLDADSVITNATFDPLKYFGGDGILTASQDWCAAADERYQDAKGINFGNFILRNTPDTQRFLAMPARHTQYATRTTCCWEQDAVLKCMREDPWFNSQVARLQRRTLNAVHPECAIPSITAPDPWQSGDFIIHLTNVPDRPGKVAQFDPLHIESLTEFIPSWWDQGMCADKRHILWIRDTLKALGYARTLEIGTYHGASSSAFIDAGVPDAHFSDIDLRVKFREVVRGHSISRLHQRKGCEVLREEEVFDLVFVDGNHALDAVTEEVEALLAKPPKVIIAHDVNSSAIGFEACEGAKYLWDTLLADGWSCVVDMKVRPNERTDRGLLMATKDPQALQEIERTILMSCW